MNGLFCVGVIFLSFECYMTPVSPVRCEAQHAVVTASEGSTMNRVLCMTVSLCTMSGRCVIA